jgi:hypothetical protein
VEEAFFLKETIFVAPFKNLRFLNRTEARKESLLLVGDASPTSVCLSKGKEGKVKGD